MKSAKIDPKDIASRDLDIINHIAKIRDGLYEKTNTTQIQGETYKKLDDLIETIKKMPIPAK